MKDTRADPYALLKAIRRDEDSSEHRRGQLKIFFRLPPAWKDLCHAEAAHSAKKRGIDVAVGYGSPTPVPRPPRCWRGWSFSPPGRRSTMASPFRSLTWTEPLPALPSSYWWMNWPTPMQAAAATAKRYQDVEELLKAGINVYTTVNVQHIESLNDMVASISGVIVRERIPDKVFDNADQVELVDIEPQDLIERLNAGQVYREEQTRRALDNFFSP